MQAFRYEDLEKNAQEMITAIFQYCNVPLSEVNRGLQALSEDSQPGSY